MNTTNYDWNNCSIIFQCVECWAWNVKRVCVWMWNVITQIELRLQMVIVAFNYTYWWKWTSSNRQNDIIPCCSSEITLKPILHIKYSNDFSPSGHHWPHNPYNILLILGSRCLINDMERNLIQLNNLKQHAVDCRQKTRPLGCYQFATHI